MELLDKNPSGSMKGLYPLAFLWMIFLFSIPSGAQNPFDNPSFENTGSVPKSCQGSCAFPNDWNFDDCNPEGAICEQGNSTDGSVDR